MLALMNDAKMKKEEGSGNFLGTRRGKRNRKGADIFFRFAAFFNISTFLSLGVWVSWPRRISIPSLDNRCEPRLLSSNGVRLETSAAMHLLILGRQLQKLAKVVAVARKLEIPEKIYINSYRKRHGKRPLYGILQLPNGYGAANVPNVKVAFFSPEISVRGNCTTGTLPYSRDPPAKLQIDSCSSALPMLSRHEENYFNYFVRWETTLKGLRA